jgi:AcrR family transcriptional regulator
MRPQKVIDTDLLNGLMEVLRSKGYDGTTLNDLATISGLKKASLYHRFPGGKKEIASSVLQHLSSWLNSHLLGVLKDVKLTPEERLDTVLKNINQIYDNGSNTCILGVMCTSNALNEFSAELRKNMDLWIEGFSKLGEDCGLTDKQVKSNAVRVLVLIEGSLIVSNTFDDIEVFQDALKEIRSMYFPTAKK